MSEINEFNIPKTITINNYVYTFKSELINNNYSYRCKYRNKCKILIKIGKDQLIEYLKNNDANITCSISSTEKIHNCE